MGWPLLLRPLPRHVAPVRDETITSYLARLAEANRLDPAGLRHLLSGNRRKDADVPFAALVAVTGITATQLAWAMPQLCTPPERAHVDVTHRPRPRQFHDDRIACRPCTGGRPVTVWALHEHVVCRRHRRWISEEHDQPDLTAQPEILDAARRHRWLIRRHGRDTVMRAYRDARHICSGWRLEGYEHGHDPGFIRRMQIFHGPGWADAEDDSYQTYEAATYPQVVALTRLLASPYWRERILEIDWPWHDEFINELRRTVVAPDYIWNVHPRRRRRGQRDERFDPLLEWKQDARYFQYQPLPPDSPWMLPETLAPPVAASHNPDHAADRVGPETWDTSGRQTVPAT